MMVTMEFLESIIIIVMILLIILILQFFIFPAQDVQYDSKLKTNYYIIRSEARKHGKRINEI